MTLQIQRIVTCSALLVAAIVATGCDTPVRSQPGTTGVVPAERLDPPVKDRTDVNVDIGNGRGINVDVDRTPSTDRKAADVDVNIGGPEGGIRVDVDK